MGNTNVVLDKYDERRILLNRLFYDDRDFYKIGEKAGISWFDSFEKKFTQDTYAHFANEEKKESLDLIVTKPTDEVFAKIVTSVYNEKERYSDIKIFVGKNYYFDVESGVKCEDRSQDVVDRTKGVLEETKDRARYFLMAIIDLYKEKKKWDKVFRGATWEDILEKVRDLGGSYPSPRDISILKSFRIYFKTGSRRYPIHTVPEEMIPTIESILKKSKR